MPTPSPLTLNEQRIVDAMNIEQPRHTPINNPFRVLNYGHAYNLDTAYVAYQAAMAIMDQAVAGLNTRDYRNITAANPLRAATTASAPYTRLINAITKADSEKRFK